MTYLAALPICIPIPACRTSAPSKMLVTDPTALPTRVSTCHMQIQRARHQDQQRAPQEKQALNQAEQVWLTEA